MVRSFATCVHYAHTLPALPVSAPPCGGIGVDYWDSVLAAAFAALCALPDDNARYLALAQRKTMFRHHAALVELGDPKNLQHRDELLACADLLERWQDELLAAVNGRRAAA